MHEETVNSPTQDRGSDSDLSAPIAEVSRCPHAFMRWRHSAGVHEYLLNYQRYCEEHMEREGARIFRFCPGCSMVGVADHVAARWLLEAPPEKVSRSRNRTRVNLRIADALAGGSTPPVAARGEEHRREKGALLEIYRSRARHAVPALHGVLDEALALMSTEPFEIRDVMEFIAHAWSYQWLFDAHPSKESMAIMGGHYATLTTDSRIANALLPGFPLAHVGPEIEAAAELIRRAPAYPTYLKIAASHGVPTETLAHDLLSSVVINSGAASGFHLLHALVSITTHPEAMQRLLAEQEQHPYVPFRRESSPWLHCLYLESSRMHPQKQIPRVAEEELLVPTSDGGRVRILAGEDIAVLLPLANRDPLVWQDPDAYDPARFERDPSLEGRVLALADSTNNHNGCAGAAGLTEMLWKVTMTRLICGYRWSYVQEPSISLNHLLYIAPKDLLVTGLRPRVAGEREEVGPVDAISERFRHACTLKNELLGDLSRKEIGTLYGLYKQALFGDAPAEEDANKYVFNARVEGLKRKAWLAHVGKAAAQCKQEYVELVDQVVARRDRRLQRQGARLLEPAPVSPSVGAAPCASSDGRSLDRARWMEVYGRSGAQDASPQLAVLHLPGGADCALEALQLECVGHQRAVLAPRLADSVLHGADRLIPLSLPDGPAPLALRVLKGQAGLADARLYELRLITAERSWTFLGHGVGEPACALYFATFVASPAGSPELATLLAQERARRRAFFTWREGDNGLPGYAHLEAQGEQIPEWDQYPVRNSLLGNIGLLKDLSRKDPRAAEGFTRLSELQAQLRERYPEEILPPSAGWASDREFAESFVAGCQPTLIERCEVPPEGFEAFQGQPGLYLVRFDILEGLKPDLPAPRVLLQDRVADGGVVPLGIQLERGGLVFTPDDEPADWIAAKLWAALADANVYECCTHYWFSHVVQEAIAVSMHRNLTPAHPLYPLMAPFLRNVIAATALGRSVLFDPGQVGDQMLSVAGTIPEMFRRCWMSWSLRQKLNLPKDLEARGVTELSAYPYAEDGLLIWEALRRYIDGVVKVAYADDAAVTADRALQLWLIELTVVGLPGTDLPSFVESRAALSELLTGFAFGASAVHGAQNGAMFQRYGFIPAAPHRLDGAYPRARGEVTVSKLLSWMPDRAAAEITIDTMAFLGNRHIPGRVSTDEDVLLSLPCLTSHPEVQQLHQELMASLSAAEAEIARRNADRRFVYPHMAPGQVTCSVSW